MGPDRTKAQMAAKALLQALCEGRIDEISAGLSQNFWAAWPNGRFLIHKTENLREALIVKQGEEESPVRMTQWRVYNFGEIKKSLQSGLAEILDAFLGLQSAILVTVTLSTEGHSPVRVMMAMEQTSLGNWKSRNLPMVSPDDVHLASLPMASLESPTCKRAYGFIREVALNHSRSVQGFETYFTPHIWLEGKRYNATELFSFFIERPLFQTNSETGIVEICEWSMEKLRKLVSNHQWEQFETDLQRTQLRPLARIRTAVVKCVVGTYNPKDGQFRNLVSVYFVMVIDETEATGHEAIRITAIFRN